MRLPCRGAQSSTAKGGMLENSVGWRARKDERGEARRDEAEAGHQRIK